MDCGAKTALPRYAVESEFPKAFTTNGQKTSWRLVRSGFLAIRRALQPTDEIKDLHREAHYLKVVVAEQTLELRILKKT